MITEQSITSLISHFQFQLNPKAAQSIHFCLKTCENENKICDNLIPQHNFLGLTVAKVVKITDLVLILKFHFRI